MQRKMRAGRWMEGDDGGKFGRKEGVEGGDLSGKKLQVASWRGRGCGTPGRDAELIARKQ
jgi:hypothetical protein